MTLVGSYPTFSPLPRRRHEGAAFGGVFSVPLSVGFRRLGLTPAPCPSVSGLSSSRACGPRPPGLRHECTRRRQAAATPHSADRTSRARTHTLCTAERHRSHGWRPAPRRGGSHHESPRASLRLRRRVTGARRPSARPVAAGHARGRAATGPEEPGTGGGHPCGPVVPARWRYTMAASACNRCEPGSHSLRKTPPTLPRIETWSA